MSLKERREAEYIPLIKEFLDEVKELNHNGITGPHMPGVGECYENTMYKFAFCGMETYGWNMLQEYYSMVERSGEDGVYGILTSTDKELNDSNFLSWLTNDHATFWGFALKFLSKFYHVNFNELKKGKYQEILHSFIWANSNSIERYEVSSQKHGADHSAWEKVKEASKKFDDLKHIINSCQPRVVFICYKDVDEEYFLNDNNLSGIFGIQVLDKSNYLKIPNNELKYDYYYARNSRTHIFKLPHPRWMGIYSGKGIDAYVESIIQDLHTYHVWDALPSHVEEWKMPNQENVCSMDRKIKIIADLAHALTLNDTVMTGVELASIFNMNNIKTEKGWEFSSDRGRGIYRVISLAWKHYQKNNDFQTAYEIARSYVKPDGSYAYD